MFTQYFIKPGAAVHELSCPKTFRHISQRYRIQKSGPVTLNCNRFHAVVNVHVHAKFHLAKLAVHELSCVERKKNYDENNTVRRYRGQ